MTDYLAEKYRRETRVTANLTATALAIAAIAALSAVLIYTILDLGAHMVRGEVFDAQTWSHWIGDH